MGTRPTSPSARHVPSFHVLLVRLNIYMLLCLKMLTFDISCLAGPVKLLVLN